MFPLLVPLLSLIATTIVIAPRMFLATRANHVVEALEAVAVLLSQGKRITAAYEAVSADLKIPYGNFARWMKNMKRIEVPPWLFLLCFLLISPWMFLAGAIADPHLVTIVPAWDCSCYSCHC